MLKVLLLSLSRQYTVDGQYIPSLFIEPEVRHDKTSYTVTGGVIVCFDDVSHAVNSFTSCRDDFLSSWVEPVLSRDK